MNLTDLTGSPWWLAAGWTMLHLTWLGAVVGLFAALSRRCLQPARPELRLYWIQESQALDPILAGFSDKCTI